MKRKRSLIPRTASRLPRRPRGIALVLVLSIIVLITALVLAFFSSVSSELSGAKNYAAGGSTKQLADAATQLVIGTLRKATSQTGDGSGTDVAWASQPGMIRTWNNGGNPSRYYKLFSSDVLEGDASGGYDPAASDIDVAFNTKPAIFTDLNKPVELSYAQGDPVNPKDPQSVQGTHTLHYPILDPAGSESDTYTDPTAPLPPIPGFSISNPPGSPAVANAPTMPVRWLYVLQNGTLLTPTGGTTTAMFTGSMAPTQTNPIIGRMAYWTDDESCKVNINTASEGVYWDMPHIATSEDVGNWSGSGTRVGTPGLALCQPAKGEYQRYPGHPATTSLSPILSALSTTLNLANVAPTTKINSSNNSIFKIYYDLVPRITQGGSMSGAQIPNINNPSQSGAASTAAGSIKVDNDRLFSSVDELIFSQPTSTSNNANPNGDPTQRQPLSTAGLSKAAMEKARFFLTAHSNAPEVTMFNTPRVSMWPVWQNAGQRTVLDSTLAFCADVNVGTDTPYYFSRSNSRDMHADYDNIPRNKQLYAYLQKLMSSPVPGYGGTFSTSFGTDSDQVLTNIFDYIRCINLCDTSPGATQYTKPVRLNAADDKNAWGGGEILPIKISNGTQGFGRFSTLAGMDLVFCAVPPTSATAPVTKVQAMLVPTFFSPMQGLPAMYPKLMYTITGQANFKLGTKPIFFQPTTSGGLEGTCWTTNAPVQQWEGRAVGGVLSPRASLEQYGEFTAPLTKAFAPGLAVGPSGSAPDAGQSGSYPFVSVGIGENMGTGNITLDPALGQTMVFTGGDLTVKLYPAEGGTEPIQTFTVNMPSGTFPTPKPQAVGTYQPLFGGAGGTTAYTLTRGASNSADNTYLAGDVVRGVEIAGHDDSVAAATNNSAGDARMVAARSVVVNKYYHAHHDYNDPAKPQATGAMDDDGSNSNFQIGTHFTTSPSPGPYAGSHGSLVNGLNPRGGSPGYGYKSPYVPSRTPYVSRNNNELTAVGTGTGDWDTGYAMLPDGPLLNMGDTGDQAYIDEVNTANNNFNGKPRYPYVVKEDHFNSSRGAAAYFSPNRQVPSSMMLGSIPTGVQRFLPWQTLLFNPKPEDTKHPGNGKDGLLPDHLIADLFWMPIVEPYPISQPFSTAGKINMNYQIEPFTHITRSTGLYAVMKATKMMAMPISIYSGPSGVDPKPYWSQISDVTAQAPVSTSGSPISTYRYPVDARKTLAGFDNYFTTKKSIFKSATQISELNLVPYGTSYTYDNNSMAGFWQANPVTGDNVREKPYVNLYPRLTTKSNSYTVHFRVQSLQKVSGTDPAQWVEGKDQITSDYRGSSEIERYLDTGDTSLPDFATVFTANPQDPKLNLDKYYRYRVISTKRFSPY